jgi:hypothetical protein
MKVYITSTPEFSNELVKEVVLLLNQTPGELEFISIKPLTVTQYSLTYPKMNSIETIENLTFDEFFSLCNKYRIDREIPNDAYVAIITSIKNDKRWFGAFKEKNIFIHGMEWEYYTKRDSKYGISFEIVENIFQSLIGLNIIGVNKEPHYHMESIGCINDMCMNKADVMLKLRTADICDSCLSWAEEKNINPLILDHIYRIIRCLREEFVNSSRINLKVKPENVHVNPERIVKIGLRDVRLDPLNKVLFIFFLKNLEGVETKLIFKWEDDLYQIYKEIRDNPDPRTITKLVNGRDRNFEINRTRLNQSLVNQLGPNLAEYYILDRIEIKDDYNRYKINLGEEYITIEPSKRK